jgi:hypothetical protein
MHQVRRSHRNILSHLSESERCSSQGRTTAVKLPQQHAHNESESEYTHENDLARDVHTSQGQRIARAAYTTPAKEGSYVDISGISPSCKIAHGSPSMGWSIFDMSNAHSQTPDGNMMPSPATVYNDTLQISALHTSSALRPDYRGNSSPLPCRPGPSTIKLAPGSDSHTPQLSMSSRKAISHAHNNGQKAAARDASAKQELNQKSIPPARKANRKRKDDSASRSSDSDSESDSSSSGSQDSDSDESSSSNSSSGSDETGSESDSTSSSSSSTSESSSSASSRAERHKSKKSKSRKRVDDSDSESSDSDSTSASDSDSDNESSSSPSPRVKKSKSKIALLLSSRGKKDQNLRHRTPAGPSLSYSSDHQEDDIPRQSKNGSRQKSKDDAFLHPKASSGPKVSMSSRGKERATSKLARDSRQNSDITRHDDSGMHTVDQSIHNRSLLLPDAFRHVPLDPSAPFASPKSPQGDEDAPNGADWYETELHEAVANVSASVGGRFVKVCTSCVCIYIYTRIRTYVNTCTCIYIYTFQRFLCKYRITCMHSCILTHIHTCTNAGIHTYTHT